MNLVPRYCLRSLVMVASERVRKRRGGVREGRDKWKQKGESEGEGERGIGSRRRGRGRRRG